MKIADREGEILRDLARQVAELASAPPQQVLQELWRKHNDLQGEKIMIVAYIHDAWQEFFSLQIENPLLRDWEWKLRHTIQVAQLGTDEVITTYFPVPYVVKNKDYGLSTKIITSSEAIGHQGAYRWEPPLKKIGDIEKLVSGILVDFEATQSNFKIAQYLFGDILDVQLDGGFDCGMDEKVAMLRGIEQVMVDMYENPEFLHKVMAFIRDETIESLKYAETNDLLRHYEPGNWSFTSQLPAEGFDGKHVRLCDLQGNQASQTFVGVSPHLFDKFLFQYQKPVLELFGQAFYGCCEPLHDRIEIVAQLKNLRRISISAWADLKTSAEKLQDKYILSLKLHPSIMAMQRFDPEEIRKGLQKVVEITRGCHLEIFMKDATTYNGHPERLKIWVDIAQELAEENACT